MPQFLLQLYRWVESYRLYPQQSRDVAPLLPPACIWGGSVGQTDGSSSRHYIRSTYNFRPKMWMLLLGVLWPLLALYSFPNSVFYWEDQVVALSAQRTTDCLKDPNVILQWRACCRGSRRDPPEKGQRKAPSILLKGSEESTVRDHSAGGFHHVSIWRKSHSPKWQHCPHPWLARKAKNCISEDLRRDKETWNTNASRELVCSGVPAECRLGQGHWSLMWSQFLGSSQSSRHQCLTWRGRLWIVLSPKDC